MRVKKAKFFKDSSKMGPYSSKKLALFYYVIRTRETTIILNPTFWSKAILALNVSAKFEWD